MIQPLFEHRRSFAGYESRVLELEGDGVPVVLFHGYGDSADTWRQLLALLSLPAPVPSPVLRAAVARLYAALAFGSPRAIDRGVVSAFTSHHRDRATVAGYLETARRLIGELRDPFALERIEVPVLLVWGDRDRLAFHRGAQRVPQEVPGARLQLLRGVGTVPRWRPTSGSPACCFASPTRQRSPPSEPPPDAGGLLQTRRVPDRERGQVGLVGGAV